VIEHVRIMPQLISAAENDIGSGERAKSSISFIFTNALYLIFANVVVLAVPVSGLFLLDRGRCASESPIVAV
jgi:hypothetical protein